MARFILAFHNPQVKEAVKRLLPYITTGNFVVAADTKHTSGYFVVETTANDAQKLQELLAGIVKIEPDSQFSPSMDPIHNSCQNT